MTMVVMVKMMILIGELHKLGESPKQQQSNWRGGDAGDDGNNHDGDVDSNKDQLDNCC